MSCLNSLQKSNRSFGGFRGDQRIVVPGTGDQLAQAAPGAWGRVGAGAGAATLQRARMEELHEWAADELAAPPGNGSKAGPDPL